MEPCKQERKFYFYQSTYFTVISPSGEVHLVNPHIGSSKFLSHSVLVDDIKNTGIPLTEDVYNRAVEATMKVQANAMNDDYLYDSFVYPHKFEIMPLRKNERYY